MDWFLHERDLHCERVKPNIRPEYLQKVNTRTKTLIGSREMTVFSAFRRND